LMILIGLPEFDCSAKIWQPKLDIKVTIFMIPWVILKVLAKFAL